MVLGLVYFFFFIFFLFNIEVPTLNINRKLFPQNPSTRKLNQSCQNTQVCKNICTRKYGKRCYKRTKNVKKVGANAIHQWDCSKMLSLLQPDTVCNR